MKKFLALFVALLALCPSALAENASVTVVVPEGYAGALPVYQATYRLQEAAPLFEGLDPSWFNQSGEASFAAHTYRKKPLRSGTYLYPDESSLDVSPELIWYREYDGVYESVWEAENGEQIREELSRPSFRCAVYDVAGGARQCWPALTKQPRLAAQALPGVTLEEAKAETEALLARLGMENYVCVYALDMTVERIADLGRQYNEALAFSNMYKWDYSAATEQDQGFFLYYEPRLHGASVRLMDGGAFNASAYVSADGVHAFTLYDYAAPGPALGAPETLTSAQTVEKRFEEDNPRRVADGRKNPRLLSLELAYTLTRAETKSDGMTLIPAWYATYSYMDGSVTDGWAWYSALDGSLLLDCY